MYLITSRLRGEGWQFVKLANSWIDYLTLPGYQRAANNFIFEIQP